MAKRAFLDDNKGRDYPILKGMSYTPFTSILACGFVIGPNTGFIAGQHNVALSKVKREFGRIWFYFTCDAPGLLLQEIIFSRPEDAEAYAIEYADSSSVETGSLSESASLSLSLSLSLSHSETEDTDTLNVCGYVDDFSGFLITGPLDDLLAILPENETFEASNSITGVIEPALIQDLSNTYVRSVNLANIDRTKYVAPSGCEGDDVPDEREVFVNSTCIQGKIVFTPGSNASVTQNNSTKSISFSAVVGAGAGEPCEQVPLYEGEVAPYDSNYLEGGPSCNEVIRSISGASGPRADLSAEGGVDISYEPSENKVIIDINLKALSTCENILLVGEALYDDCHHDAGIAGEGPGGGRGVTEFNLPSFSFAGLGLFATPGERVGLGAMTLPAMITTGGGGSSGAFSTGFSGYGALSLPSISATGSGSRPFNVYGPGIMVLPKFIMSGNGTGTFTPPVLNAIGSGGVSMSIMTSDGAGIFIPYSEPPPLGDDYIEITEPETWMVFVGKGGSVEDQYSEPSYIIRAGQFACYAPPGQSGFNFEGGRGGGRGETNPWPDGYLLNGFVVAHQDGGDGALCEELDAYARGGGGGGAAGRYGPGNPGGQPYVYSGGDGRDNAPGGYATSGQGSDAVPTPHTASIPGGGGAGLGNDLYLRNGAGGLVAIYFDNGGTPLEIVFDTPGVYEVYLGNYSVTPNSNGHIECWGGGGIGAGGPPPDWNGHYNGGGGSGYSKSSFHLNY